MPNCQDCSPLTQAGNCGIASRISMRLWKRQSIQERKRCKMTDMLGTENIPCPRKFDEIIPLLITAGKRHDPRYDRQDAEHDYIRDPLKEQKRAWEEAKRLSVEMRHAA